MDTLQLKTLASCIRATLKQSSCLLGHNQSLDLIAAIPGLRNWPEVQSFPQRVAAARLDLAAVTRLTYRIHKQFGVDLAPDDVLATLRPHVGDTSDDVLDIWPAGPAAGVYLTTSRSAIAALLDRYDDATDGSIVYAESVARNHHSAIYLDEGGLWSSGLERAPSGTLLVLGPVTLDQRQWNDAGDRLVIACVRALAERHRVAVLIDTPASDKMYEDVLLLLSERDNGDERDLGRAVLGSVTEEGHLQQHHVPRYPRDAQPLGTLAVAEPQECFRNKPLIRELLQQRLSQQPAGVLVVASASRIRPYAMAQVPDVLALTRHAGAASIISPTLRTDDSVDRLPAAVAALPILPSVQSAHARGYRRFVIAANDLPHEVVAAYPDALFIVTLWGSAVDNAAALYLGTGGADLVAVHDRLIAIYASFELPYETPYSVSDLYIPKGAAIAPRSSYELVERHLVDHRDVEWEEAIQREIAGGFATPAMLRAVRPELGGLESFLARFEPSDALVK